MATSPFIITEHIVDGQHIREYPHATRRGDDALKLVAKRYTPKSNPNPQLGDVTIIGAHGSGFPKEMYEPIWEGVLSRLNAQGVRVRSIWIADNATQSASGVLNEEYLGNDPSWFDHARDLLYLINYFKADMPRPIVGVGHSLGAGQLKDMWPSQLEAAKDFKKAYRKWDPRAIERYIKYGLRDVLPETDSTKTGAVTLTTSRHQEVVQYMRPNFHNKKPLDADNDPESLQFHDTVFYPDTMGPSNSIYPFYRCEPVLLFKLLKHIRPSVLYLYGESSPISTPDNRARKLERTGKGIGGSGGYKNGRVKEVTFPGAGHALPFEAVDGVSDATSAWLQQEIMRWKEEEERIEKGWVDLQRETRTSTSDEWRVHLKMYSEKPKNPGSKL
uniref:Peroxisomal membrane protein LPX1 n=1 Tax=Talaromyces marneffei PM1 TaxID=1077442 RepID=A0A093VIB3_TALMA